MLNKTFFLFKFYKNGPFRTNTSDEKRSDLIMDFKNPHLKKLISPSDFILNTCFFLIVLVNSNFIALPIFFILDEKARFSRSKFNMNSIRKVSRNTNENLFYFLNNPILDFCPCYICFIFYIFDLTCNFSPSRGFLDYFNSGFHSCLNYPNLLQIIV